MSLEESLILSLIDTFLLGVMLLIIGFLINILLEKFKGEIALQNALAQKRADAFGVVWEYTEPLTPRGKEEFPTEEECDKAFDCVRDWYYTSSGAMYLTLYATSDCLNLLNALEANDPKQSKKLASKFRTQLKIDMGIYHVREGNTQIPLPLDEKHRERKINI